MINAAATGRRAEGKKKRLGQSERIGLLLLLSLSRMVLSQGFRAFMPQLHTHTQGSAREREIARERESERYTEKLKKKEKTQC